jgi:hypothetical protein
VQALDFDLRRSANPPGVLDQHPCPDGAAHFEHRCHGGLVRVQMHRIHEVGGERSVRRVGQAMARADAREAIDAMAEETTAADQIGAAERQLGMGRPEIFDA